MARRQSRLGRWFERLAQKITTWTGSTQAFLIAAGIIIVWIVTGPLFNYSDTWQLVINTGTTVITFLMVFLIQRQQNKDSLAMQLKLNELIAAMKGASNRLIDIEDLSEEDLRLLHKYYEKLVEMAKRDVNIGTAHSIEEAQNLHRKKYTHLEKKIEEIADKPKPQP